MADQHDGKGESTPKSDDPKRMEEIPPTNTVENDKNKEEKSTQNRDDESEVSETVQGSEDLGQDNERDSRGPQRLLEQMTSDFMDFARDQVKYQDDTDQNYIGLMKMVKDLSSTVKTTLCEVVNLNVNAPESEVPFKLNANSTAIGDMTIPRRAPERNLQRSIDNHDSLDSKIAQLNRTLEQNLVPKRNFAEYKLTSKSNFTLWLDLLQSELECYNLKYLIDNKCEEDSERDQQRDNDHHYQRDNQRDYQRREAKTAQHCFRCNDREAGHWSRDYPLAAKNLWYCYVCMDVRGHKGTDCPNTVQRVNKNQYGFLSNVNTTGLLNRIVNEIYESVNKDEAVLATFMDLSKAFDTVRHDLLLTKLEIEGIRGLALNLMKSYLFDRGQRVKINGVSSQIKTVSTGVPQGTVLGPLLFILYVNDIFHYYPGTYAFADDTIVVSHADTWSKVQDDMRRSLLEIDSWFTAYYECVQD
ncbi:hypothetical protein TKK_0009533 [Trichogramma kaykai]